MNDLVFVMYNLKLKERQLKRNVTGATSQYDQFSASFDDISSDDECITEKEDSILPQAGKWLHVLDRCARRDARNELRNESTDEDTCTTTNTLESSDDIFEIFYKENDLEILGDVYGEGGDDIFKEDVRGSNDIDEEIGMVNPNSNKSNAFGTSDEEMRFDE